MLEELDLSPRTLIGANRQTKDDEEKSSGSFKDRGHKTNVENTGIASTLSNPLKLFPGVSFSIMFRFLLVSRIYRGRVALLCRKNYGLQPKALLILLAASGGHFQQGVLARSLDINKNAMVFLIDNLELRHLVKRVANPDNRREKLVECTPKGERIAAEVKANYQEIIRWGLYPLEDAQIEQFRTLLAQIIEATRMPPVPCISPKENRAYD
jgi:DNA-binding MarR family transcriptional regulator